MYRLMIVLTALTLSLDCTDALGQHHRLNRSRRLSPVPDSLHYPIYDYGMVQGYVYDPYARGRFEMYDPADDPYLKTKYKYDTFFPGRRSRRTRFFRRR